MSENNRLPRNFGWLENSKLAGCGRPESEAELKGLKDQGIRAIVSLTSTPLNPQIVSRLGFEYMHSPLSGAPRVEELDWILKFVDERSVQSKPVVVHCGEGLGRTGTVLAAYLINHGLGADEAIKFVREKRPGSIQTLEQEKVLRDFEKLVQSRSLRSD